MRQNLPPSVYSVFRLTSRHIPISAVFAVVLCVLTLLALWAAYMFVKITWGAAGKPSLKSQLIAGLITTIVGAVSLCSLVATAIKSGNELPQSVMPAVMLLVSGIVWSHRAWKQFRGKA